MKTFGGNKMTTQLELEKPKQKTSYLSVKPAVSDTVNFSVVMPIHNEAKFLPFSLPSVYNICPSEVILLFDRCSDDSEAIAAEIISRFDPLYSKTICINDLPENTRHNFRVAFLKRLGMDLASCDVVLTVDADLILDPNIKLLIEDIIDYPFISFEHVDYPVNWRNLIKSGLRFFPLWKDDKLTGIYAVDLNVRAECEDPEKVRSIELGEDTLMQQSIKEKYPVKFFHTNTVHLRPKEDSARHYRRGRYYWKTAKRGFFKTVLSAIISGRYNLIKGYVHARFGGK
jgi:glycosyltransferase involved in cell wall biosynthesis